VTAGSASKTANKSEKGSNENIEIKC